MFRCTTAVLLLAMSALAHAGGPAKTPEQLIQELSAAAKEGDTVGFLSYLTANARGAVEESVASQSALRIAEESFQEALDERFGKGAPILTSPPMDLKSALSRIRSIELLSKKAGPLGTVYLRVETSLKAQNGKTVVREDTFVSGEEGGSWKLELNPGQSLNAKAVESAVVQSLAALRSGQFTDRRSALLGLSQARLLESGILTSGERMPLPQTSVPPPTGGKVISIPQAKVDSQP
jgi:hypothetical protein